MDDKLSTRVNISRDGFYNSTSSWPLAKMEAAAEKRVKRASGSIDRYTFFFHAIPPESEKNALSLDELHDLVGNVWLARHDTALEEERKNRRKGRPKSTKEMQLENLKETESEEYRTGIEVPDLTHPTNVELFRRWDQSSIEFIDLLRFIRINSLISIKKSIYSLYCIL
ncbi:hypothetical protein PNOK_0490900 [Pyrrhoderma noxium]|uniref:Uncharacterized protein n=1 Tax=Pyrrhoderma noxium TaxID=2282107 RepID=A0A286UKI0_9AGAM|nr:hypothetical protein PNOK_0490900 [Pyrrhoderma noxium]